MSVFITCRRLYLCTALSVRLAYVCFYLSFNSSQMAVSRPRRTVPYSCIFIDATPSWFLLAAYESVRWRSKFHRQHCIDKLQKLFETDENPNRSLPCLSVRSAFDLWLSAMGFGAGSEVIMTAVNIPQMESIVRAHHLVPVPCDISPRTLEPVLEHLESLITDRSVAVVVAHLFGRRLPMTRLLNLARKRRLYVVEDCAESFSGLSHLGEPDSDLALFSFGAIKHLTCFGGAIAKVRETQVYNRMQRLSSVWPVQSYGEYLSKVLKCTLIAPCLNSPGFVRCAMPLVRFLKIDHKALVVRLLRTFPTNLLQMIRRRPSDALLSFMCLRLSHLDDNEFRRTKDKGDFATKLLGENALGTEAQGGYWLFPIVVKNPEYVVKSLNEMGIDAYSEASQLCLVAGGREAEKAKQIMTHLVYVPVHKNVPVHRIDWICSCVRSVIDQHSQSFLSKL